MFEAPTTAEFPLGLADESVVADLDEWFRSEPGQEPPLVVTAATSEPSGWAALDLDLFTSDAATRSDAELIEGIVGFDRLGSWAAARQARLLAELARRRPADPVPNVDRPSATSRFVPDEVGVALKLSRGAAAGRVGMACRLLAVLPEVHALWESGRIDTAKARAIDEATAVLSDEHAAAVAARVLPRAPEQSLAQLRAALARAILAVDPDGAAERHREARKDRRVHVQPEAEGMASLWALLTATDAAGAYSWLTRLARGLGTDDPRTMDARRADLLAALLNGRLVSDVQAVDDDPDDSDVGDGGSAGETTASGATGAESGAPVGTGTGRAIQPVTPGKPLIQIVMAHSTLIGADDQPAELIGYGPIPAELAREIAADGVWRRLITDPLSGTVLDYGRTTYHPPAGLADHVRARDQHCRFPLCRRKAADAELDHAVGWADGGTTCAGNLHALCLHHHKLKTHADWRIEAHHDGRLTWITPTGHRHTTAPHDYRPDAGPKPLGPASPPPHSRLPNVSRSNTRRSNTRRSLDGEVPSDSSSGQATGDPDSNPPPF